MSAALAADLARVVPDADVGRPRAEHLGDASAAQRGLVGKADAVVIPTTVRAVEVAVSYCYSHDVPIVARGGGSGLAGGATPQGGCIIDLTQLARLRSFEPALWRMHVEAGMRTSQVHRRAREHGLMFPPDPGAGEQSTIGGNVATNAGGPHALRYGATGAWVTGLELVGAWGQLIEVGGVPRKLVDGLDLTSLVVGSEGVLGVVTGVRLRLAPTPDAAFPIAAVYPTVEAGCRAMLTTREAGIDCSVLDYADAGALEPARASFPDETSPKSGFMILAEVDGDAEAASRARADALEVLAGGAITVHAPTDLRAIRALWRWRDDLSLRVAAIRGGKLSEDVVVPIERLDDAIHGVRTIGERHEVDACSWGHAGDGNVHATFLIDPSQPAELERASVAAEDVFVLARELGGGISGEHGIGLLKRSALIAATAKPIAALHRSVRAAFDPKGLFNPGKAIP